MEKLLEILVGMVNLGMFSLRFPLKVQAREMNLQKLFLVAACRANLFQL